MDPIIATGLVSIGEKIVNNLLPKITGNSNVPVEPFSQHMAQSELAGSGKIGGLLQANNVNSISDLQELTSKLSHELYSRPELAEKLAKLNPEEPLTLCIRDGVYSIESAKGQIATLNPDSEIGVLAQQVHQLKGMLSLNQQTPGSNMSQLVNMVTEPSLNATWSLRSV